MSTDEDIKIDVDKLEELCATKNVRKKTGKKRTVKKRKLTKCEMNELSGMKVICKVKRNISDFSTSHWKAAVKEILISSNATPISHHTVMGYKCCFCTEHFQNPCDLKQHSLELHKNDDDINNFKKGESQWKFFVKLDITDLHCNICKQAATTLEQLIEHLNSVHKKNVLVDIKRLIFPFRFENDELRCCHCLEHFHTYKVLQEHMNTHYTNFVCDICSAGFITKSSLLKHHKSHKNGLLNSSKDTRDIKSEICENRNEIKIELRELKQSEGKNNDKKDIFNAALCHLQSGVRDILTYSNATAIGGHSGSSYRCAFCSAHYSEPADLKQHSIQLHTKDISYYKKGEQPNRFFAKFDITNLHCNICKEEVANIDKLIEHLNNIHNKNINSDMKKLIFPFKFHGDELRCCDCLQNFHTFKALQSHMHSHYTNFVCPICSAGFITISAMQIHKMAHSTGSYKCSYCDKTFLAQRTKKQHEEYTHNVGPMKNVCRVCNERFKDYRHKKRHLVKVHGVGPLEYKCQSCDKVFQTGRGLTNHTRSFHLMQRPHKCQQCEMSFYTTTEIRNHMLKHTGQREFQCDICLKKYARKYTLIEHMRIHLNDRRFKCKVCAQAFVQKCSLKGHMRSKHGELA